jgi:rubrerythrin
LVSAIKGSEPLDMDSLNLAEAIQIGIRNEKSAVNIYTDMARVAPLPLQEVLAKIIREEQAHLNKLLTLKNERLG